MLNKTLFRSVIRSIKKVARDTYLLSFENADLSRAVYAGQFLEIKVPFCDVVLWRRPFSIHNTQPLNRTVQVLFHAVGRGTSVLTQLEPGIELDILGPLGNRFQYDDDLKQAVVVAGGLGIAPFMLMMRELQQRGIPMQLFYGVGSADQFCGLEMFEKYATLHLCTEDGSRGRQGLVTELLTDFLDQDGENSSKSLYVCGPTPMLRVVQDIAAHFRIAAQVSVETIMACGFGACVGCAVPKAHPVPGKNEYFLACTDGPVFNLEEIIIDD